MDTMRAGGLYAPSYAGIPSFFRVPRAESAQGLDAALFGIPYDAGASFRPGARFGPRGVREMSMRIPSANPRLGLDPLKDFRTADIGDLCPDHVFDLSRALDELRALAGSVAATGAAPVACGGDHGVSLPVIEALAERLGEPLGLVHFDAHADTAEAEHGSAVSHASPFRNAVLSGALDPKRCVQLGIRGGDDFLWEFSHASGMRVIGMDEFETLGAPGALAEVRRVVGTGPVYVSFDIDALDPAFAPGTGTWEMGGLTSREALALVRGLAGLDVRGGDVVEVAPDLDHAGVTAWAAANLLYEILCLTLAPRK